MTQNAPGAPADALDAVEGEQEEEEKGEEDAEGIAQRLLRGVRKQFGRKSARHLELLCTRAFSLCLSPCV